VTEYRHSPVDKMRFPNQAELRYLAYSGLAQGVRGMFWWSYHRSVMSDAGWLAREFAPVNREFRDFTRLVAPAHRGEIIPMAKGSGVLAAHWRRPSGEYWLVVNARPDRRPLTIDTRAKGPIATLTAWGSTRKVGAAIRDGVLAVESAEPWEVFVLECGDSSPLSDERGGIRTQRTFVGRPERQSGDESPQSKDWPHAPVHRLSEHGTYIVTAGTYHKEHWFRGAERLDLLESALLRVMKRSGWRLEAWAVFSNHYHFVAHAETGATPLRNAIKQLHGETSREVNRRDGSGGRAVWHNFWDTALSFEKSYLARLNYVHHNAVKHGPVAAANQYRWCSAAWFERTATPAQVQVIYRFKIDEVKVRDEYEPL
jgi:putative transposase